MTFATVSATRRRRNFVAKPNYFADKAIQLSCKNPRSQTDWTEQRPRHDRPRLPQTPSMKFIEVEYNKDLKPLETVLSAVRRPGDFFASGVFEPYLRSLVVD
jgi:hypothetical protein